MPFYMGVVWVWCLLRFVWLGWIPGQDHRRTLACYWRVPCRKARWWFLLVMSLSDVFDWFFEWFLWVMSQSDFSEWCLRVISLSDVSEWWLICGLWIQLLIGLKLVCDDWNANSSVWVLCLRITLMDDIIPDLIFLIFFSTNVLFVLNFSPHESA